MITFGGTQSDRLALSDEVAFELSDLRKSYGRNEVLHGIDLKVHKGEIFGIIGPDGAGKSTMMHIVAGVSPFNSGKVRVLGKDAHEARQEIGFVSQQFSLYPELSIEENLNYAGGTHNVDPAKFQSRKNALLKKTDLLKFVGRLASQLSGGMKQKLALCCALIAEPQLLLLDEPTVGVDPLSRLEFWELLADAKNDGMCIVVATPYYEEADRCDRVALLSGGVIEVSGTPERLKQDLGLERLELYTANNHETLKAIEQASFNGKQNLVDIYPLGDRIDILLKNSRESKPAIEQYLAEQKIAIKMMRLAKPTMENVFMLRALKAESPGQHGNSVEIDGNPDVSVASAANPPSFSDLVESWKSDNSKKSGAAISAEKLVKKYGSFAAVNNLNLELAYGEIYGLLGANGAGKTTTIKMLCGLQTQSSGVVRLAGESKDLRNAALRKRIGYMSQKSTLYADMTVKENLEFYAAVYGIPNSSRRKMIDWALSSCGMEERRNELIANLPKGLNQRVAFTAAVMHSPEILFLDEPTSGVDPIARRYLWQMIRELAASGAAVLVTTHGLDEAEYCNRLGIMVAGRLLVEGTAAALRDAEQSETLEEAFIKLVRNEER